MSGYEHLKQRLEYRGGFRQQDRMIADKLNSLKKALIRSYQGANAELSNGKQFLCLMNQVNLKTDYDIQMISIPFQDICINSGPMMGKTIEGIESIGLKCGDVFKWKQNNTYWIIYRQHKNELAYFRAEVKECEEVIEINGHKYPIYIQGPTETDIIWAQKAGVEWNSLNYTIQIYITKNEETLDFFHRFQQIKINNKNYQVLTKDEYAEEGIIQVFLGEHYNNEMLDNYTPLDKEEQIEKEKISGPAIVGPYETITYEVNGLENGYWCIDKPAKAKVQSYTDDSVTIVIIGGKSGEFNLIYRDNNTKEPIESINIKIASI